jgi:hypothetical protein
MKKNPRHVDVERLRELMAGIKLTDPKMNEYINARWLKYVEWWDFRSRTSKLCYHWLRIVIVVSGALIPALVGLRELGQFQAYAWIFAVASIVVSLLVAICTGVEGVLRCGEIWREKRMAVELLTSEGFSFLQLAGPYAKSGTHQKAFVLFAQNVEDLIRREIKDYVVAIAPQPPAGQQDEPPAEKPAR